MAEIKIGRLSETIYVTVAHVSRLRGSKGDTVTSFAKVEFDGKSLGDSAKVESTPETDAKYNFTTSFDCSYVDGPITLDDIASKPVIISIYEVLPKEKKQKEEKVSLLCQCSIDLFSLFDAHEPLTYKLELYSVQSDGNADVPKPEVEVILSVKEPLIDPDQQLHSNLLQVRLGSVYSIPDAWSTPGGHFNYIVGLPVPTSVEKDTTVLFNHGVFRQSTEKELTKRPVKWINVANATHCAQYIPNSARERVPISEEKGELCGTDYTEFRRECESERNRITWDAEKRCYLPSDARTVFQNRIAQSRLWPVEVLRTLPTHHKEKGGKKEKGGGAASTDDDGAISYHGVAYVDLAALLYPGVCSVAGAFRIHPFNETEMMEKTKQKNTITDDVMRVQSSTSRATGISPVQKGKGGIKDPTLHVPAGKKGSALRPSESVAEVGDAHFTEASAFVEHKTYVYIEFSLSHPLVPRRKPEELAKRVSEYIPPRPAMKRIVGGADKAVEDYHSQLSSVATMILDEFRLMWGDTSNHDITKLGEMKKELMYQLNSTGKYFAFKEQLKHSIVKIVREKYMKTTTFKTNDELQQFLTELYVFLIDEMHANLQKAIHYEHQYKQTEDEGLPFYHPRLLHSSDQMLAEMVLSQHRVSSFSNASPRIPLGARLGTEPQESIEPVLDSLQLKRFAQEAEVNEDYVAAAKYYQERLTKDDKDPGHWLDYGAFNLHTGNHSKAKHCFEQTVAIQQDHLEGLLLYGIMSSVDQDYERAETMLQRAVSITEEGTTWCSLAWAVLALFYDSHGNEIRAEHAFLEAHRLNILAAQKKHEADKALEKVADNRSVSDHAHESENESEAVPVSTEAVPAEPRRTGSSRPQSLRSAGGSTVKGSKHAGKKDNRARSAAECSSVSAEPKHEVVDEMAQPQSIFLITASWLLDHKALKFAEIALSKELLESRDYSHVDYYIALSRLQLMNKQYEEALSSLDQATAIDHQQPDAWAMMGHVNYVSNNIEKAQDCYERTLAFVNDASEMHSIYLRLASIYLQKELFEKAKNVFLLACKHSPTCLSWLGVGNACYRMGEIIEAEDALAEANILNNSNAEVWAYLSLVCLKTSRKLESEQAYKYALRLGLNDETLLEEMHSIQKQVGFGNPSL